MFAVGDRVRINSKCFDPSVHGCLGTVTIIYSPEEMTNGQTGIGVEIDGGYPGSPVVKSLLAALLPDGLPFNPSELEAI